MTTENEMLELKARMGELYVEISAMKAELRKKQEQYYKVRLRFEQLDREQAERKVKRIASTSRKTKQNDNNAYELIARLTPTQQAELLAALR